jgi:hypothetical protein
MKKSTTVYRGIRVTPDERTGSDSLVYVDDKPLSPIPSQKIINHSPDGFNWGYGGPAQLALAILLDYYGDVDERRLYQSFKFRVIAVRTLSTSSTATIPSTTSSPTLARRSPREMTSSTSRTE